MKKNRSYANGAAFERSIVKLARDEGYISSRSAGSHGPIDLFIIDNDSRHILFIQSKHRKDKYKGPKKKIKQFSELEGTYVCSFMFVSSLKEARELLGKMKDLKGGKS